MNGVLAHGEHDAASAARARRGAALDGRPEPGRRSHREPALRVARRATAWRRRARPAGGSATAIVAYDYGVKWNILRELVDAGFDVTVVPASTPAREALRSRPDGVFLGNGPGDPRGGRRTRSRSCASWSRRRCRSSASASATRSSASRSAARRRSCASATTARTSRRATSDGAGRDRVREPRLRRRRRGAAEGRRRRDHAREPERRHRRGPAPPHAARVLGAVPPRGVARAARPRATCSTASAS